MASCAYRNLLGSILVLATTGCQPQSTATNTPSHDDFRSAVQKLDALHSQIANAFSENKPDDAHDALHGVGELLVGLPKFAEQAEIGADALTAVKDASSAMLDIFTRFDDAMHEDKPVDFESQKDSLAQAMARLKDVAASLPSTKSR